MASDSPAVDELFYVNGVNASTGEYLDAPLTAAQVAELAKDEIQAEWLKAAQQDRDSRGEPTFGAVLGVDENDLSQAGWGVVFAQDADPAVQAALQPLLDYRQGQAGSLFKIYQGVDGYQPTDDWESFRIRHQVSTGQADPQEMPYYLLIVGDPESIPYHFQYHSDLERAVGRIAFPQPEDYARYADSVTKAEKGLLRRPPQARFFATANFNDKATQFSSQDLVAPMSENLAQAFSASWDLQRIDPASATKSRLAQLIGGVDTPAFLFSATHGAAFNRSDPRQSRHQGALVTQDWPGRQSPRQPLLADHYFSADDIPDDAHVAGLVAMFFACFSAGTPTLNDFYHLKPLDPTQRLDLADKASLAPLAQRLLSHPNGAALAVVGHIDRAWAASFKIPGLEGPSSRDFAAMQRTIQALLDGYPIGLALEEMNSRYATFSTQLTTLLFPIQYQGLPLTDRTRWKISRLWTANNDARNYLLLGDPAVRLALGKDD